MAPNTFEADLRAFEKERGINVSGKFLEETTLKEYVRHVRRWHETTGEHTPTMQACRGYVIDLAQHSPSQGQYAHRALKRYSHWLSVLLDSPDPLATWKMNVSVEPTRTPVAEQAQLDALLAVCTPESKTGLRDHAIISILAYTGMRRSEVARMQWDDVDFSKGTIFIPKTKTAKPRLVQMPTAAQRSLRRYLASCTKPGARSDRQPFASYSLPKHVWWSHRGPGLTVPLSSNGIQQMLVDRSRESGVKVTAHSFRRFYAVYWLANDGSQAYLQKQAGWADGRMVAKYVGKVAEVESGKEALRLFG